MSYRPDWGSVYGRSEPRDGDQDLISVTRETLRISLGAIRDSQARDSYENYSEAWREIEQALGIEKRITAKPAMSLLAQEERLANLPNGGLQLPGRQAPMSKRID